MAALIQLNNWVQANEYKRRLNKAMLRPKPKPHSAVDLGRLSPTAGLLKSKNATIDFLRDRMRRLEQKVSNLQVQMKHEDFKRIDNRKIAIVNPYRYNPFRKAVKK